MTATKAFAQDVMDPDEIGNWVSWDVVCTRFQVTCPSVTVKHLTKKEIKNKYEIDKNAIKMYRKSKTYLKFTKMNVKLKMTIMNLK